MSGPFSAQIQRALRALRSGFIGTGGLSGGLGVLLSVDRTTSANIANTNPQTLWSYVLPANALARDGDTVEIEVYGDFGNTANNKTIAVNFGALVLSSQTMTTQLGSWYRRYLLVRDGAAVQIAMGWAADASTLRSVAVTTGVEVFSGPITIAMVGTSQTTGAAGDVVKRLAVVKAWSAPG